MYLDAHGMMSAFFFACIITLTATSGLLADPVNSQEITMIDVKGTCREFTVSVETSGIGEGCWDLKIDVPGQIQDSSGELKSSFFYAERAFCSPERGASLRLITESTHSPIHGTIKVRQGNRIYETPFSIYQSCPEPSASVEGEWVVFSAFAVVVILGWGIALWWKRSGRKASDD